MTMARIPPSDRPLECGVEAQVSGCAVGSLNRGLPDDRLTSVGSAFSPALSRRAPVAAQALPSGSAAVPDVAASAASHARQDGLHIGGAELDAPSDSRSDAGRSAWTSQDVGAATNKSNHTPGPWGVGEVEGVAGCSPPVPDPSASSALLSSHARARESPDVGRSGGQVLPVGRGKGRFRGMGDEGGGVGSFTVDTDARETGKRFGSPGGTGHPARVRVSSFVLCLLLGLVGGLVWSPDTQHVVHRRNATGAVSGVDGGAPLQRTLVEEPRRPRSSAAGRGDGRPSAGAVDSNGSQASELDAAIGKAQVWEREAHRFHHRSRLFGDVDPRRCVEFNGLTSTGSWREQESAAAAAAAPIRSSSSGLSTSSRHRLRESSTSPSPSAAASWPLPPASSVRPLLIIVTPTYVRPFQAMYLHRLANVLRQLPPPLLWLVVEIYPQSAETAALLRQTGLLLYRHIVARKNMTDIKDRGVHQRNAALQHIETHRLNGIVYFADDDNVYAPQLFDEIRKVRRFGTWPVAMLQQGKSRATIEGPVCDGTSVIGWHTNEKSKQLRRFHVDMSGFAFNSTILWDAVTWRRPDDASIRQLDTVKEGFQETTFIEQLVPDESHMEGLAQGCSKVLVWHVHIEAPRIAPFPHWSSPWKPIQVIPAAVRQQPHQLKRRPG